MATAKKAGKPSTAVATRKSTAVALPADVRAKLQQEIQEQASQVVQTGSKRISFSKKKTHHYVFPDQSEVPTFEGVVVDFVTVQVLYDGPYVEGQQNNIVCYASGANPKELAPLEEVQTPQASSCATCDKSKFSSDGAKPECGLRAHLSILTDLTDPNAELLLLDLPVISAKAFSKFAQHVVNTEGMAVHRVLTKFGFADSKFDSPVFEVVAPLGIEFSDEIVARRENGDVRKGLLAAPNFTAAEKKPAGKLKAPAKRRAA